MKWYRAIWFNRDLVLIKYTLNEPTGAAEELINRIPSIGHPRSLARSTLHVGEVQRPHEDEAMGPGWGLAIIVRGVVAWIIRQRNLRYGT